LKLINYEDQHPRSQLLDPHQQAKKQHENRLKKRPK